MEEAGILSFSERNLMHILLAALLTGGAVRRIFKAFSCMPAILFADALG